MIKYEEYDNLSYKELLSAMRDQNDRLSNLYNRIFAKGECSDEESAIESDAVRRMRYISMRITEIKVKELKKAEEFIRDCTSRCSNELVSVEDSNGKRVISYHEWLTPEQALRAVEIAREEFLTNK